MEVNSMMKLEFWATFEIQLQIYSPRFWEKILPHIQVHMRVKRTFTITIINRKRNETKTLEFIENISLFISSNFFKNSHYIHWAWLIKILFNYTLLSRRELKKRWPCRVCIFYFFHSTLSRFFFYIIGATKVYVKKCGSITFHVQRLDNVRQIIFFSLPTRALQFIWNIATFLFTFEMQFSSAVWGTLGKTFYNFVFICHE